MIWDLVGITFTHYELSWTRMRWFTNGQTKSFLKKKIFEEIYRAKKCKEKYMILCKERYLLR
jgi:hypothetical protein